MGVFNLIDLYQNVKFNFVKIEFENVLKILRITVFIKKIICLKGNSLFLYFVLFLSTCFSQEQVIKKDQYQIGADERLLITVHIWGEVRKPGEYLVPDDTDLLELISKAGGPTEYSDLKNIKITRGLTGIIDIKKTSKEKLGNSDDTKLIKKYTKQVIKIDLKKLLDKEIYNKDVPTLQPGDVIRIGRNTWFTWQAIIRMVSQLAIVAQVWYWYSR